MRTVIVTLATAAALCAGAASAGADQCAWLDDAAVAERAARELARASKVIQYCEPCGDAAPGAPADVGAVSIRPVDRGFSELLLDERGVDLAYTYVLAPGAYEYRNLALITGCPADGVSPTLRIDTATTSGVLIHGDSTPRPTTATRATQVATIARQPAEPRWEAPAPQPTVIVVSAEGGRPTTLLELLLGATLIVNTLLMLSLVRRRYGTACALPRARIVDRD